MKLYKQHKYIQPKDNKYCALYNVANVFNVDLDYLSSFESNGIGTKDLEYIIQKIGYPKSYIAVLNNVINPHSIPEDALRFIINTVKNYAKSDKFIVMPTVIRLKNNRVHWITLLLDNERIVVSDPRKSHMIEVTMDELIKGVVIEQIASLINFRGYRKHSLVYINK